MMYATPHVLVAAGAIIPAIPYACPLAILPAIFTAALITVDLEQLAPGKL